MRHGCPEPEDLLAGYGPGGDKDALREHVADCARCRSLLAARDCFLSAKDAAAGDPDEAARLADADARLADVIARATGTVAGSKAAGGGSASAHHRAPARRSFWKPSYTWPTALAAVLVAATGIWLVTSGPGSGTRGGAVAPREQIWRGAGDGRLPAPAPQVTIPARGGLRLDWRAVAGADRYVVTLLDGELATLADLDAGGATGLDLSADAVPDRARGGFFVVTAYVGKRELGRWSPVRLP